MWFPMQNFTMIDALSPRAPREWNVARIPGTPVRTPARLRLELILGRVRAQAMGGEMHVSGYRVTYWR